MQLKYFRQALLLTAGVLLSGCGDNSNSSENGTNSATNYEAELNKAQSDFQSAQSQAEQVIAQLAAANQKIKDKKEALDAVQAQTSKGLASQEDLAAAQREYEAASEEVRTLEARKAAVEDTARKLKEKTETLEVQAKIEASLNGLGAKVLGGDFSADDLSIFAQAVESKSAEELVRPANKFVSDLRAGLSTVEGVRTALPKLIQTPLVKDVLVLVAIGNLQPAGALTISQNSALLRNSGYKAPFWDPILGMLTISRKDSERFYLHVPIKEVIGTLGAKASINLADLATAPQLAPLYSKLPAEVNLEMTPENPMILTESLRKDMMTLQPFALAAIQAMPDEWLRGIVSEVQKELGPITSEHMSELKASIPKLKEFLKISRALAATSSAVPADMSGTISSGDARRSLGGKVDFSQFSLNNQPQFSSIALSSPLTIKLKGNLDSEKRSTAEMVGSVAYHMGNAVFGFIQSYANEGNNFSAGSNQVESSALLSYSFGGAFVEGQAGIVSTKNWNAHNWSGGRYQLTLGYDSAYVAPFIQYSCRTLNKDNISNSFVYSMQIGLDVDVLEYKYIDSKIDSKMLVKVGYESTTETLIASNNSLLPNSKFVAQADWLTTLSLNSGIKVAAGVSLNQQNHSFQLSFSLNR